MSSCTAYTSSWLPCAVLAWKSSPCCSGVSGSTSAISIVLVKLIDLVLAQPGRRDIRRGQPAPAASHMRADAGQGVKPQPAQPARPDRGRVAEGAHVQLACRCGPTSVSTVPALSSTVCISGIGTAAVAPVTATRRPGRSATLITSRSLRGGAQPSQVVEPDRRVGLGQVDVGVQIAQQTVGQRRRAGRAAAPWRP